MIYVANQDSNTVSIINGSSNRIINIPVGSGPSAIAVNPATNMIYVANQDSNTVSIINGSSNRIIIGIASSINPSNSGDIYCNNKKIVNNYAMYDVGTNVTCEVRINGTSSAIPFIGDLLESITKPRLVFNSWSGLANSSKNNPTTFTVSRFGVLTANLRQTPPLMPEWLLTTIVGIIISAITALYKIITTIRRRKYDANVHEKKIDIIYKTSIHNKDACLAQLREEKKQITEMLLKGIINKSSYKRLNNRILSYEEYLSKL
jgi:YVTN family beta-propeller protein